MLRRTAFLLPLLLALPAASPAPGPVLLVFAHPDDEILVAPLAAALTRRSVPVQLVLATAGERGAPADGSIPAGPELARVRTAEAQCSARALGIAPPRFLGFEDGSLGEPSRPTGARLAALSTAIAGVISETSPRAIVTWGPDGGYGHPDHRLVSAVTSAVVLTRAQRPPLLYVGLPADAIAATPPRAFAWAGVDRALLTVSVPYTAADLAAMRSAALCHKSQYPSTAAVDFGLAELTGLMGGRVHLRPAAPPAPRRPFG
jgi:LmbE family N-acetylglucosaminyl deacetylase